MNQSAPHKINQNHQVKRASQRAQALDLNEIAMNDISYTSYKNFKNQVQRNKVNQKWNQINKGKNANKSSGRYKNDKRQSSNMKTYPESIL